MKGVEKVIIQKILEQNSLEQGDFLAVEEPLEIRLTFGEIGQRQQKSISVTMRTPDHDIELAIGFLFTEGIIKKQEDLLKAGYVQTMHSLSKKNIVKVELSPQANFHLENLNRHFYTSSSCGVCGKASIEAVYQNDFHELIPNHPIIPKTILFDLPDRLLNHQAVFETTGGLHAAALFDEKYQLLLVREDVGRHNAVDKLIGAAFLQKMLPLSNQLILVSGRVGFELVQKSLMAGIPILAAVGAPTSLATQLANEADMTLIGFLKKDRFNIYTHPGRIAQ